MKERFHETLTVDQNNSSDRFLIALLNLMKEKSFFDISISELCHAAKLSRTTFYKFFQDKDALLDYLAEDLSLGFVAYKESLHADNLPPEKMAFVHYFSFWYQVREWVDVLVKDGLWERIAMPNEKALSLLSKRSWDAYLIQNAQTIEMMQHFIAAGCVQLVKWWSNHSYEKSPGEMADLVVYSLSGKAIQMKSI